MSVRKFAGAKNDYSRNGGPAKVGHIKVLEGRSLA